MARTTSAEIWFHLTEAVRQLLDERGEEPGELGPETRISADLGISSVDAIHLLIMLEDAVGVPLSFQQLAVRDGAYVEDLALGEIRAFVCRTMGVADLASASR